MLKRSRLGGFLRVVDARVLDCLGPFLGLLHHAVGLFYPTQPVREGYLGLIFPLCPSSSHLSAQRNSGVSHLVIVTVVTYYLVSLRFRRMCHFRRITFTAVGRFQLESVGCAIFLHSMIEREGSFKLPLLSGAVSFWLRFPARINVMLHQYS